MLGIDFGYATDSDSFGYSQFEVLANEAKKRIRIQAETKTTNKDHFVSDDLTSTVGQQADLMTLGAPITHNRILDLPAQGRLVEKRFSRGRFSNGLRGPQPSSIRVPKQGWALYCHAMDFMEAVLDAGFSMPTFPDDNATSVTFQPRTIVEVCPKLTQAVLTPRNGVTERPNKFHKPSFYRQIANWLFARLFVPASDAVYHPTEGTQPTLEPM